MTPTNLVFFQQSLPFCHAKMTFFLFFPHPLSSLTLSPLWQGPHWIIYSLGLMTFFKANWFQASGILFIKYLQ